MPDVTTLYLVRHAESAPDFSLAEADWPLSPNGTTQARRLATHLSKLGATRLIASPYRRAVDTFEPCSRRTGLPIYVEADLRERRLRDGYIENWDEFMRGLWADPDAHMPNCESGTQCRMRVTNCLTQIAEDLAGETLLICSHGNAIALFLSGIDASFGYEGWKLMRNADVFRVRRIERRWQWDRAHVLGAKR